MTQVDISFNRKSSPVKVFMAFLLYAYPRGYFRNPARYSRAAAASHVAQGYRVWIFEHLEQEHSANETASLASLSGVERRRKARGRRVRFKCDSPGMWRSLSSGAVWFWKLREQKVLYMT